MSPVRRDPRTAGEVLDVTASRVVTALHVPNPRPFDTEQVQFRVCANKAVQKKRSVETLPFKKYKKKKKESSIFKKKGKLVLSGEKQLSTHEIIELWAVREKLNVECTKCW